MLFHLIQTAFVSSGSNSKIIQFNLRAATAFLIGCFVARSSAFSSSSLCHRPALPSTKYCAMNSDIQNESNSSSVRRSLRKRTTSAAGNSPSVRMAKMSTKNEDSEAPEPMVSSTLGSSQLLENWLQHNHHSYHLSFLAPPQAYAIRCALVDWYRANRRKLPWRGDVGPFNGSTSGFSNRNKDKKKKSIGGGDIRTFFGVSATKSSEDEKKEDDLRSNRLINDVSEMRMETKEISAYGVWVSEIMLQQTRVEAVIPYYLKWMQSFPTVEALADATPEKVNSHWAGLGFYRRARLLHQGAKRVVDEYDGVVPSTVDELMKIEGIGRYTASAIASIAFGVEVPVVDGNVCRVLSRLTGVANHIKAGVFKDDLGWVLAEKIVHARAPESQDAYGTPGEVNQALMELGATYCSPSGSGIEDSDPLKQFYMSTKLGTAIEQNFHISKPTISPSEDRCRLCDPDGISSVFYDIVDRINQPTKLPVTSSAAMHGHAALPMAPPKKAKREEVLAVAAVCLRDLLDSENRWLLVKRPSEGLLAGQWEFPSVCLWDSSKNDQKIKAPSRKSAGIEVPKISAAVRSAELDSYLCNIFQSSHEAALSACTAKRLQINDPVVHVFSHVSHTMYIEKLQLRDDNNVSTKWKTSEGREVSWFSKKDMQDHGITSGVRKILALTEIQP